MALREHELKNDYIGEYHEFIPWANTLLYLPLNSDLLDHWPNNISVTNNWVTLSDSKWVFNGSSYLWITWFNTYLTNTPFTVSFWINVSSFANQDAWIIIWSQEISWTWYWWNIVTRTDKRIRLETQWGWTNIFATWLSTNTWYYVVWVFTSTTKYIYLNWSLVTSASSVTPTFISRLDIWYNRGNQYVSSYFNGSLSQIIIESKERTAQEIQDYYNNTKANYWL